MIGSNVAPKKQWKPPLSWTCPKCETVHAHYSCPRGCGTRRPR